MVCFLKLLQSGSFRRAHLCEREHCVVHVFLPDRGIWKLYPSILRPQSVKLMRLVQRIMHCIRSRPYEVLDCAFKGALSFRKYVIFFWLPPRVGVSQVIAQPTQRQYQRSIIHPTSRESSCRAPGWKLPASVVERTILLAFAFPSALCLPDALLSPSVRAKQLPSFVKKRHCRQRTYSPSTFPKVRFFRRRCTCFFFDWRVTLEELTFHVLVTSFDFVGSLW